MHAPTLPSVLRHTRRTLPRTPHRAVPTHATHVAPAAHRPTAASWTSDHQSEPAATSTTSKWRISDLPERARIRPVRWLPLIVPGFALLLMACMALIGSVV